MINEGKSLHAKDLHSYSTMAMEMLNHKTQYSRKSLSGYIKPMFLQLKFDF